MKKTLFALLISSNALSACDLTIESLHNIQKSLKEIGPNKTLCLEPGAYFPTDKIVMLPGQEIRGLASDNQIIYHDKVVIFSNQSRAIVANDNTRIRHLVIRRGIIGPQPTFGILAHYKNNVTIWSVKIQGMKIGIGLNHSNGSRILNTFINQGGDLTDNKANPSIWISNSDYTYVHYGHVIGRGNGPGGDGEIATYNSKGVTINGTHVTDSGASAIYMVNCDNCKVINTRITRADEWGIDVVQGSDNFVGKNNIVSYSNFGGSVFDEAGSTGGLWDGNKYKYNNIMGVGNCEGINIKGNPNNVTLTNNTSTGNIYCIY